MKKNKVETMGEYFESLGFKKGAKSSSKAAFVQYLLKEAYGVEVAPPEMYQEKNQTEVAVQLSFFDDKEIA